MCGRFAITLPDDAMASLFDATVSNDLPAVPNFNVCPTNQVHVVTSSEGIRHLGSMRWGFLPKWYKTTSDGPLLINARSETLSEKPAFRAACRERRCLIPASGFYEWTKDGDGNRLPWYISPKKTPIFAFGGVWQRWERGNDSFVTCAIVTTAASDEISSIHHRMPVVIAPSDWPLWLGEVGKGAATLMKATENGSLNSYRVDPKVNSNRAKGPELIEAV